ncbi:MAG TPA: hypothetical protein ENH57_02415 [Actinobacteria bacterium]|nr:hypothetical protein [Actinomycetota bacterium]
MCRVNASRNKVSVTDGDSEVSVTPKRTRATGCKVAIPGDEDYTGCVVDGRVVKTGTKPAKDMPRFELDQAIRAYPNDQWINSPEHKELMRRLHSMTIEQLEAEGYYVPGWKVVG